MKWAMKNNQRSKASPKDRAKCPVCKEKVIAKCGAIKTSHWAHKKNIDCDSWYEPETLWHLNWKDEFNQEQQEIIIKKGRTIHRADIKTNEKIIELQYSSISSSDIKERENFYGDMVWLLNGLKFAKNMILRKKDNYFTFRWKYPPKSWWEATKPIFIDLDPKADYYMKEIIREHKSKYSDKSAYEKIKLKRLRKSFEMNEGKILEIKKIYKQTPCGGWGKIISKDEFIERFR